jgi:hypothetical protein
MTIGIADVRTDLAAVVLRLSEKLSAFSQPFLIHLLDVGDANVEEGHSCGSDRLAWSA